MTQRSKRKIGKRRTHGVRKIGYILLMIIIGCAYICGQYFCDWERLTETVATIIAIIAAVAFWLEYRENKLLNEAQFITDLNDQFIGDENMSQIEWELEKYYNCYRKGELTEEYKNAFKEQYSIDKQERQQLVNYLVHLEGIAALVKNKVLRIQAIDDLMSYRYFIAVNNPVVQEIELLEYPEFYKGCLDIYNDWVKELTKQGVTPPMYDVGNNNLTRKLEDKTSDCKGIKGEKHV